MQDASTCMRRTATSQSQVWDDLQFHKTFRVPKGFSEVRESSGTTRKRRPRKKARFTLTEMRIELMTSSACSEIHSVEVCEAGTLTAELHRLRWFFAMNKPSCPL